MGDVNLNPDDYSLDDIYTLMGLDEPTVTDITYAANAIIEQAKQENNEALSELITALRDKAIEGLKAKEESEIFIKQHDDDARIEDIWEKEYNTQPNKNQKNKITNRINEVKMYEDNNPHPVLFRNHLGVSNTYCGPVAQGSLNPNLKNIITRTVCIDSQFRQNILPYKSGNFNSPTLNTDYTLDLSDPLKNVLSIRLSSIQIPTSWYTLSKHLGNTCFQVNGTTICINDGNYTLENLCSELHRDISNNAGVQVDFSVNPISNKIEISSSSDIIFTFYKPDGFYTTSIEATTYINNNLGWYLGFRREPDSATGEITIKLPATPDQPLQGDVPINIYGPRYFILVVDDYNQNHLNKGLVNTINTITKVALPDYYMPGSSFDGQMNEKTNRHYDMSCNRDPQPFPYKSPIKQAVAQNPRKLTQAQLYSINEILLNQSVSNVRTKGPTTSNTLAIIPLDGISNLRNTQPPSPFVATEMSLQTNKREYFGPVNIERLRVRLLDDKGNIVDLNDNDWSFTMVIEQLYQY